MKPYDMSNSGQAFEKQWEIRRRKIRKDAKRSAVTCALLGVGMVLLSSGMPAHRLARWIGVPIALAFMLSFAVLLFTCANILSDRWSGKH